MYLCCNCAPKYVKDEAFFETSQYPFDEILASCGYLWFNLLNLESHLITHNEAMVLFNYWIISRTKIVINKAFVWQNQLQNSGLWKRHLKELAGLIIFEDQYLIILWVTAIFFYYLTTILSLLFFLGYSKWKKASSACN